MAGYYDRDRQNDTIKPTGTMNHAYAHHASVSEYQVSGIPFCHTETIASNSYTAGGSGHKDQLVTIQFPYVTRWIMVYVHNGSGTLVNDVKIGFGNFSASKGVQGENFVTTGVTNQVRMELKAKKMYLVVPGSHESATNVKIEIIAGLTSVKDFPNQDAALINGVTDSDVEGTAAQVIFTSSDLTTTS